MKIAVVYNRESQKVINLFGVPNREKYGLAAINRIVKALKKGGHQVIALEGDKDLIDKLEEFMPRVVKGERPGIVFNLSYGIQGQARYTHVPSILEMVGIPYVGSGPLAHSLALDKVVAKTIFRQNGLPTPDFAVLDTPNFDAPELRYPLIVKPKNEAVSLGLKIVNNEEELREAARFIFDTFQQPVLVEEYIEGREINVGILGNDPPEPFEPVEIVFGNEGPPIYTYEDKTRTSGREIVVKCPAPIPEVTALKAKEFAIRAFRALGCYDCARVDMRLDKDGNLYILELNSLPSLGEHGSYVEGAKYMGLDFAALVNRLVDVAVARYFGMPSPPKFSPKVEAPDIRIFNFLVDKREEMERGLREWITLSSRTGDPVGMGVITDKVKSILKELGLQLNRSLSLPPHAYLFETKAGLAGGTLLISHLDVPLNPVLSAEPFHIEPEWIYGEGIGVSRAPLVMTLYVLKALKKARYLDRIPLGLLLYNDEGLDCIYSADTIKEASLLSRRVLVLRPGNPEDKIIIQRRGQRIYRIVMEGKPLRPG
ncbi:MAG: ATP-grasp domain-containing protein, partial [Nitrospirae bacterium]